MKRRLGSSDIEVFPIGLGGMPMSIRGRPPEADAIRTIHAALDAGIDFIDTADVYCFDDGDIGHNERLIRDAIRSWSGKKPIVATKGGLERPNGAWTRNAHPVHLKGACEKSLTALGVEAIDLYQLHAPDPEVPYDETIGALADLVREGKIRHVGLSNVSVAQIEQASKTVAIASVQNRCNPFDRSAFTEGVVAYCETHGIAFLPYSPVGGGRGKDAVVSDPTLGAVSERHGATPFQVALAWLLDKSPAMIPIPGASKPKNATSSARATSLRLTGPDRFQLDAAFPTSARR